MKPKGLSIKTRIGLRTWYIGRTALLVLPIVLMQAIVIVVLYFIVRSNMIRAAKTILILIDLAFGESFVYSIWFVLQEKFMTYQTFRQKVASETKSERLHEELLTNDSDEEVRLAAVSRVCDINRLSDIARNDENWRVRSAAADRIHHPSDAEALLRSSDDPTVRVIALSRICNAEVLREYALNDLDYRVRAEAVGKIESPEILLEIIDGEQSECVWRVCLPKLIQNSKADGIIPENVRLAIRNAKYAKKMLAMRVCPFCCSEVSSHREDMEDYDYSAYFDSERPEDILYIDVYTCSHCARVSRDDFAVSLASFLNAEDEKSVSQANEP